MNGDRPAAQVVPAAAAIVVDETLATEVPPPAGAMPAPEATRAADMGRAGGTVGGRRVRGEADSA